MQPKRKKKKAPLKHRRALKPRRAANKKTGVHLSLEKFEGNPIIQPNPARSWESKATFNPAALYEAGRVHLLYRAIGDDDMSVLGYASSRDGFHIDERLDQPAYYPREPFEGGCLEPRQGALPILYFSGGGGWGGCEDPRMVALNGKIYMTYQAFNGWGSVRIALTSIGREDFLSKRWNWSKPVLLSPPGEIHKNWVLFPEKVKGKYALLHSISPDILIDYFDSLDEFTGEEFIRSYHCKALRRRAWDSWVRGAGPPPIKTKYGWLLFYHAIDQRNSHHYKLGAMVLDLDEPTKILARSKKPVLDPEQLYEEHGLKPGIVYSCGAVAMNDQLLVYYGGADMVTCVASAEMDEFLKQLVSDEEPKLKKFTLLRAAARAR